jgi:hypothetical protein
MGNFWFFVKFLDGLLRIFLEIDSGPLVLVADHVQTDRQWNASAC